MEGDQLLRFEGRAGRREVRAVAAALSWKVGSVVVVALGVCGEGWVVGGNGLRDMGREMIDFFPLAL